MAIADTDNPDYQRAYKTGYRLALAGKGHAQMPHDIRHDGRMREYFVEGWQAAQDDMVRQQELLNKPDWRYRIAWLIIMVLGGLATAGVMLKQAHEQNPQVAAEPETPVPSSAIAQTHSETITLLSDEQRRDISDQQRLYAQQEARKTPLAPLTANLEVEIAQPRLVADTENIPLDLQTDSANSIALLPKYLRKLAFHTQVRLNSAGTLFLVWRYNGLEIQKQSYELSAGEHSLTSTQLMSSSRQGRWHIEVLDGQQRVFQRMTFDYGQNNESH
ncbi:MULTISPECIES: DUF2914 domain-containing protein [Thiomicrorhabdus]|uniref:DUF2914 domain-containing protein n=1 Tax=Thiomicrorhabdus xiamenensis TaxID=2739063 RepID=A0A7D4NPB3_9GAMM|nr:MULTISPECIES: DUF2914 domain-containing protein [Thiomicrorhabdus]MBO1925042.1 DUF2914 domain-containing protein [Thiomicrorhabdus sp. 6S3-12]QKI88351.1 DUF2914 domain-containing protein [Thiomicrorhabdus xiamenensis]